MTNKVINYVHIKNMFVHKDTKIEFQSGKNFIIGPVGSGKTLINEAIAFALFGTTALRGKASGYDKKLEVELNFNYKNELFHIKRKLNDASLSIYDSSINKYVEIVNSTSVVNQKIINLLGYNYDVYLLSNYSKQKKLSYFSDLTPAKRLQYIDKISGIEESKEYSNYLIGVRKSLRDNIAILKDMVVKPSLNPEVDLEFDYDSHIKILNDKLNSINQMYSDYNQCLESSIITVKEPVLNLNPIEQKMTNLIDSDLDSIAQQYEQLDYLETTIKILENKIADIPKLAKKEYAKFTLDIVEHYIHEHNKNALKELGDIHVDCPSCKHSFDLYSIFNFDESGSNRVDRIPPIRDLYNIKDYIVNAYEVTRLELERQLKDKEQEYETLYDSIPYLTVCSNIDKFTTLYKSTISKVQEYKKEKGLYDQIVIESDKFKSKANDIKLSIDAFLREQSEYLVLKDKYLKYSVEKNVYLEKMEVYNKSYTKFEEYTRKLDIVNSLIKDLSVIVSKVKEDTIPLINYYASYYLNLMSNGTMTSIEVTDNYDLIVDGHDINLKSGGQNDLASMAFRVSLSKSVISGLISCLFLDEVDSSGGKDSVEDIMNALETISDNFQMIIVTHKDISNIENCNIIQL